MSDRDTVSKYTDGDNTTGELLANTVFSGLSYADKPAFKVVKSAINATGTTASDGGIVGFSATSHYRISHLHADLLSNVETISGAISTAISTRISQYDGLSGAISNTISDRKSAVLALSQLISNNVETLSGELDTHIDTISDAISALRPRITDYETKVPTLLSYAKGISGSIHTTLSEFTSTVSELSRINNVRLNNQIESRESEVTALTGDRNTLANTISGNLSTAVYQRISNYNTISNEYENEFIAEGNSILTNKATIIKETTWGPEIEQLATARNTMDGELDVSNNNVNTAITTKLTAQNNSISGTLEFLTNTINDNGVQETLSELLVGLQGADEEVVEYVNNFASDVLKNDKSTDERIDYLEKFCSAMASFMHVVGDLDATPLSVNFPPTSADKTVYDSITVNYDSYDQYPLLGSDTSGWKRLSDPVDPSTGGGGDGFGDGELPDVPAYAPEITEIAAADLTDGKLEDDRDIKVFTLSDTPNDIGDGVVDRSYAFEPGTPANLYEVEEISPGTPEHLPIYRRVVDKPMYVGDELWSDGSAYNIQIDIGIPRPATTTLPSADLSDGTTITIFGVTYNVLANDNGDGTTSYTLENGGQLANVMENPISGEYTVELYDATTVFLH